MAAASEAEGLYLAAILNSETTRSLAAQYQARGQWGALHFDKAMFNVPIPKYDERVEVHRRISRAATQAERLSAAIELDAGLYFIRLRGLIREALNKSGIGEEIDALVKQLVKDQAKLAAE